MIKKVLFFFLICACSILGAEKHSLPQKDLRHTMAFAWPRLNFSRVEKLDDLSHHTIVAYIRQDTSVELETGAQFIVNPADFARVINWRKEAPIKIVNDESIFDSYNYLLINEENQQYALCNAGKLPKKGYPQTRKILAIQPENRFLILDDGTVYIVPVDWKTSVSYVMSYTGVNHTAQYTPVYRTETLPSEIRSWRAGDLVFFGTNNTSDRFSDTYHQILINCCRGQYARVKPLSIKTK